MNISPLAKYFIDSALAASKRDLNSFSSLTIRIPRPPPPNAALIMTGKPIFLAKACASATSTMGDSVPSMTGTPISLIAFLEAILSPKSAMCSAFGPM